MRRIAAGEGDVLLLVLVLHTHAIREGNNGRWGESLSLLNQALPLTESHAEARFRRPSMLVTLATRTTSRATARSPWNTTCARWRPLPRRAHWVIAALAHLNLADIALIEDRREDGRDHALAALKDCSPNFQWRGSALATLARALSRLGDQASALAAGREALPLLDAQQTNPEHEEDRELLLAELPELRP